MNKNIIIDFVIPLSTVIILTVLLSIVDADIEIEKRFYSPRDGWFLSNYPPWSWLYEYGNIPAILLSVAGLVVFVLSYFQYKLQLYRKIGLFLVVFMILGPGIVVNTVFKEHWGRPRPIDIVNFGGTDLFRHVWDKGQSGQGKSFPSGHAAVGFFLLSPFYFLRKPSRRWAFFFLTLGISYGILMGIGRMVQGGHFITDVLWSGAFVYLTGIILYYVFKFDKAT